MKKLISCFPILLFTTFIFAQIVVPGPPVIISGAGISTSYGSEDYEIPNGGKVIIQYWETTFEGPEYIWIIKQAHLVIKPPRDGDIEDTSIWLEEPHQDCDLMDYQPKLNSPGLVLAASINLDTSPGVNIGAEGAIGDENVTISSAPGYYPIRDEGWWGIDWDDFSDSAETTATLDFYAKWRCPKNCSCLISSNQDASDTHIDIEFDIPGYDVEYILKNGKTRTREEVRKEYKKKREDLKQSSAWTPPTGTTRIAAVGTVRDEEVMMTTRGGSIGGTVSLETEEGEKLAEVNPDENGHFTIDFGDIKTLTAETAIIISHLDSQGNTLTSTTTNYIPGTTPEWKAPPTLITPEITYIENDQINSLDGNGFGVGTEVIIKDEQGNSTSQDVVSSSNSLVSYYMDSPVGQSEITVINDFGESKPIEVGIYNFDVRAGKMNLVKNEKTSLTANYNGLPEGTKIIFTNMSPNVNLKPKGNGKTSGNDVIFVVKETIGEVSLNLKAKQAGGWSVNYRLEIPKIK